MSKICSRQSYEIIEHFCALCFCLDYYQSGASAIIVNYKPDFSCTVVKFVLKTKGHLNQIPPLVLRLLQLVLELSPCISLLLSALGFDKSLMFVIHNADHSEEFWALHNHSSVPAAVGLHNWPASYRVHVFPLKWFSHKVMALANPSWLRTSSTPRFLLPILSKNWKIHISACWHANKHLKAVDSNIFPLVAAPSDISCNHTALNQLPATLPSKHKPIS